MTRLQDCSRRLFPIALCLSLLLSLSSACWSVELPQYLGLTILHTNDIHGHLFPLSSYDVHYDASDVTHLNDVGGAARQATLIRRIRSTSPYPVLVMSAGDVFTRGPIADLDGVPDFDVMNTIPYDVMTLGNNEFEGGDGMPGQKILFDRIKQAHFPVLSANVFFASDGKTIVAPYKIFDIFGVRIGVFGLTAPRVAGYSTAKGLEVRDPIAVAKQIVSELREKADFVIALTHIGYDYGPYPCDLTLAAEVPGIDLIIGGDSHTWLRQPTLVPSSTSTQPGLYISGTIVSQAGEWGVRVGQMDLRLRRASGHRYRVMSYSEKMIDVDASNAPAKDVEQVIDRYTKSMHKELARVSKGISKHEMGNLLAQCLREAAGTQVGIAFDDCIEDGLEAGIVDSLALRRAIVNQKATATKATVTGKQLQDFVSQQRPSLAGAKLSDGVLYIGDQKVVDTQSYTVAWYYHSSPFGAAKLDRTDLTVGDAVVKYLRSHAQ